ncbi:NAD(P)/FAD-dependent oxidoreductase [Corticibacter populi]|uniref:NAD(P)/FAD-dependent oxidoreductase n=1 Tax=Corticibacter populi TaxID=1550736 RepID=A0A3M6QLP7_9BURK|nr:NAD(P)/FAD-dependent oxidoreductase [Corticibacter populi]RMX03429.1 NAD(P)/FAD-dependent oxidoreductase [Corticibacter populi]RZS29864.1 hypothetical protein EV687_3348 [Corticibacter populi]
MSLPPAGKDNSSLVEASGAGAPTQRGGSDPAWFDAIILGAGAAGLFCAAQAGAAGCRVLLIDHARRLAEKIRISGGGRCNFTNRELDTRAPQRHFISDNPNFCRSALSRFTPQHFVDLIERQGIAYHEKHKGQLFCDHRAQDIIEWLQAQCAAAGVQSWRPCTVLEIDTVTHQAQSGYGVRTSEGTAWASSLVVATGGLSIPKIGATDLGYRIARQFGVPLVAQRPGLVPLTFDAASWQPYVELAGLALPVEISVGAGRQRTAFLEDLLFTHRGLSGPAILQISNYWQAGMPLVIDLLPGQDVPALLLEAKQTSRKLLVNVLADHLPVRLAQALAGEDVLWQRAIDQVPDKALARLAERIQHWQLTPSGTEGYAKAEVTLGGVDTRALSSRSMECTQQPGLYFIGEVVDVTGWLGGYNFQWAWASAHACAEALAVQRVAATAAS